MILRLLDILAAGDAELVHLVTQLGQGFFISKPGQIVGAVGIEFAAGNADKQRVIFLGHRLVRDRSGRLGKGAQRQAQRAVVTFDLGCQI